MWAGGASLRPPRRSIPRFLSVRGLHAPYISKGGWKLAGAIRDFQVTVERAFVLTRAHAGGFTDCFLKHGAALVYAVEVGFGQLAGSLRQDPRVVNLERTNISDDRLLSLDPTPDLASVDLSYLSLRKGVPAFSRVMHGRGELLCLVKPLFETEDMEARRTGILSPDAYLPTPCGEGLIRNLNADPAVRRYLRPVTGNNGTRRFFSSCNIGRRRACAGPGSGLRPCRGARPSLVLTTSPKEAWSWTPYPPATPDAMRPSMTDFYADYNMNLYRGCCHGCIYCDSRSLCYPLTEFDRVRVKADALTLLEKELRAKRRPGIVTMGAMSSHYNPHEATQKVTQGALTLFRRYGFGASFTTKAALCARDAELLAALSRSAPVRACITRTCADDGLCRKIEPNVSPTSQRLEALRTLSEAGVYAGIWLNPVLPYLTDDWENLESLLVRTREAGGRYAVCFFGMTLQRRRPNITSRPWTVTFQG